MLFVMNSSLYSLDLHWNLLVLCWKTNTVCFHHQPKHRQDATHMLCLSVCLSGVRNVCANFMCRILMLPCHRLLDVAVMPAQGFAFLFVPLPGLLGCPRAGCRMRQLLHPFMVSCGLSCPISLSSPAPHTPSAIPLNGPFALQDMTPSKKSNHSLLGSMARAEQPLWCH